ncbi:hypothetical protein KKC13_02310 [bacterium]|nr:hypothetical protein [bacterium]MBU1959115.1 hypothetical protein [bacterium]
MKKHITLFVGVFLFLAIGMHFKEWMSHPIEHLTALPSAGAYGLGMFHPVVFSLAGFLVLLLILTLGRILRKVVSR